MIKDLLIQKLVLSLAILNCQASTSQFFEEVLIDTSSPLESVKIDNVGDLFQFEFWSYYIATQEPLSYPQVGEHNIYDKRKQQLLFSMKDSYTGKFIAFMYANVKTTTQIIHSLIIDPWQKETYYEPKDYEGVWIMHLVVLYYQNAIIYQTFQGDEEKWLWIDFRFSQAVEFIVGGTGIINGYELGIFRGRLSKIFFQYYYRNPLDIYEGTIYWLRLNEKQETIKLIPDTIDFNGLFSKEFEFNQFGRKFSIHGWAKYNNYDQFTQQLIVRLTLFKNYQDQVNIGDEIVKIMVSLDSSNSSNCGYDVISHHYHMPYPIYLENPRNDQISIRHELPFQNILTQWHFISFEYGLENLPTKSQFRINYFEDKILNSQTFSLGDQYHHSLFINTKYYAIFGGDYTVYDQLKGKLARFEFIMNFKENLNIQYNCDETCQTCFGPSQYHCLSCPKNSNRIYLEDYNQCSCQKDYISIDKQCYSFYDLFPSLKFGINSNLTQKSLCPFGQFYLDSVRGKLCIDCPQKNPFGLMCLDCILNPMDWYKSPNCKMDMISQQISKSEDAFTYKERSPMDYDCYSIDDSYDLFLLEGVQDYCNIQDIYVENCFQLQTKHLSKDTFVYCKQNHYFEQKCILLDIACVKVDQKFQRKCIECLSGYYLSDQQDACFLCPNSCVSCVNQNQCLICETGFGLINGECQKCGKYCKTCKYSQQHNQLICLSCIDNYKYYLSLNAQDCNINSIENCLIAFEVKEEGQQIYISFDYEFDPTLYPQVTQCAKCRDGYYFHQSKLLCIQGQMENCQEFYVEMLGDLSRNVCLYASYKRDAMIYSFTDECPKFRINCLKCVIEQLSYYIYQNEQLPKTASYSCILCKNGFYAEKKTGNCVLCPAELKCLSCFQQNKYSKDDWKNQIRSFYRAHFDKEYRQHKFIKSGTSQNDSDYEVLCAQCQDGYELHENQCIKICPVSCLECVLLNNENICVKCPKGLILRNRGLINNECVKCSDNCEICLERTQKDILSINPLFNNPDFQMFSSYCLSQTNNTFYDQELGMNLYCNTNEEEIVECINTITIKLVLICNKDEYENELQRQETELDKYLFRQTHILSDQLFSSSSFSQFENDQFYQLANQKSIKQILIRIQAQQEQECIITVVDQQQITQKFSKNIFSAIDVELEIVGSKDSNNNYNTIITFEKQLTFLNFKRVYIEGIQLKLVFFEFGLSLLKFASAFEQKIELTDIFYLQQDSRITFYILMQNASEIKFSNVEFNWIARQHYLDYFIKIEQITSIQKIRIENFRVLYGSFWNTHFFWLELKKEDFVYMRDVNVEYSIFNQAFIYQTSGELEINNFKINVCYIYSQEGLFQIQNLKWFFMDNFQFTYNTLFSGKLIKINTYSSLSNMYFADNELREESLLIYNLDIEIFYIYFGNVQFTLNRYNETSKFIKLTSKAKPNREMEFYLVYIFGNKLLNTPQEELFEIKDLGLIYLEVNSLKIEQLSIERAQGIPEIVIYKSEKLILTYTQIKQHKDSLFKGIYQQYDCFTQAITNEYYYISIRIYDVSYIEINSLIIQNAQSINYPIVEIKTSNILDQQNKFLKFSDIFFANNLILITNKVKQGSIIQITFEGNYQIEIANSKFENNILHQYDQIGLINTGLLFNINCQISTINLSNLNFKRNIVTNSSNSIIYIQAEKLIIQNSTFIQNSLFDYSLLQPYLYWGYSDNQEIYIEQIVENFPIKVLTGNGKIDCQDILIKNVIISNSTSSGLYISLEKDASLLIQNTTITNISTLFLDQNEDGGVFFIDTQSAISAIIQIENINVNDVFCRNRGGLLFILTGTGSTIIKLQKIKLNNVFSLLGSIVYVDFSAYSKQTQQIILDGILIENSFQSYLKFLDNFNIRISQLFLYQQFKRCLFEITYANLITIQNIAAFQLQYEAFVNISFASKVKIANISITNSTFQDSFISLNYMKIDSNIYILDFKVQNVKVLNQILITDKCINSQLVEDYQKQICSKDKFKNDSPLNLQYNKTQGTLSNVFCVIEQINQINKESIQSLIAIIPSKTQVQIQKLYLSNIICKICESGFINFNLNDDSKLFMEEITFKDNQCGQSSCMNVLKSVSTSRLLSKFDQSINQLQFDFKLKNYECLRNFANRGTCVFIQNVKTLIQDSLMQNNTAEQQGGSIYVIGKESFFVLNSIIQYNKAQSGGGIFLKDQMNQNLVQQKTIINENIANSLLNNFVQKPSQLSISFGSENQLQIQKVKIQQNNNILIEQINVGSYSLFSNNYKDSLRVPNGQVMSQYQQFNLKKREYVQYNVHLQLIPLDQFNNQQENLDDTYCKINGRLLKENEETSFTENFTSFNQVTFNKLNYSFDNIAFYLDSELNLTLQVQFYCNSIFVPIYGEGGEITGYHNNYFLRMNINSLPCSLGEIKSSYDQTCIPCNATQGLYSLDLNSNNCSQKDDVTTSEIKSAQLKLKQGFWRPYFNTYQISQCINLLVNCNGGWDEGDTSCFLGHIGALCEECDLYNIRGYGHYSTSSKYSCGSCVDKNQNIVVIVAISTWTLISILITVRSNKSLNEQMMLKRVISKLILSKIQYHSNFGILIKMITNHLQIVSAVFTFRFTSLVSVGNFVNALSNPIQTMTHSLDCFLKDMFNLDIHYSIILWQIIMPFIYICLFFSFYGIVLIIYKLKCSLNIITTTLIYMYIYLQPFLVGGLISLISFRQISGYLWIQANVAFRYDTEKHYLWLTRFCLPLLLFIALIIPLYFLISLYNNKSTLSKKATRNKWGYLYNEYKLEAYYWELIKITVKQLLIIVLSFYEDNVVKKGIVILALIYIYQEISKRYQPFKSQILNKLDAYSANVCAISMAAGIGIYIDQQNESYDIQIPFLIILIVFNFRYLIKIFREIVSSFIEENTFIFDSLKEKLLMYLPAIQRYTIFKKILQNRNVQKQRIQARYLKLRKHLIAKAQYMIRCKNNYGVKIQNSIPFQTLE